MLDDHFDPVTNVDQGLIYRMMKPKIVLLIFVSGKIVLTGAKGVLLPLRLFEPYMLTLFL
jgi:hypothetical protein